MIWNIKNYVPQSCNSTLEYDQTSREFNQTSLNETVSTLFERDRHKPPGPIIALARPPPASLTFDTLLIGAVACRVGVGAHAEAAVTTGVAASRARLARAVRRAHRHHHVGARPLAAAISVHHVADGSFEARPEEDGGERERVQILVLLGRKSPDVDGRVGALVAEPEVRAVREPTVLDAVHHQDRFHPVTAHLDAVPAAVVDVLPPVDRHVSVASVDDVEYAAHPTGGVCHFDEVVATPVVDVQQ